MKKSLFIIISLSTFLLFSCASNKVDSTSTQENQQQEETLVTPELSEEILNTENVKIGTEEEINSNVTENTEIENTDFSETEINENKNEDFNEAILNEIFEELEEIEEPEVIELEPPEEISEIEQIIEEPEVIPEEDLITIVEEEIIENTEDSTYTEEDEVENLLEETEVISLIDNSDADLITEDEENTTDDELIEEVQIEISRSLTVKRFEYIDITYPGKGWVFMGLINNSKDLTYFGRKIGTDDTKFSLQAKNSGAFVVHFYKNDSVTNEYLDDYFEIIVLEEKGSNKTHIEAPKYIPPLPEKKVSKQKKETEVKQVKEQEITEIASPVKTEKNEPEKIVVKTPVIEEKKEEPKVEPKITEIKKEDITPVKTEISTTVEPQEEKLPDPNSLYENGLLAFKTKDYKQAEKDLTLALQYSINNKDAILFWLGQLYERESELQNINKAIEEYTILINTYPASSYWDKANKRIIYLKRFYIEGR